MNADMCAQCKDLLDRATNAIILHLRGISRLELARHSREDAMMPALRLAAQEQSLARENAVETYKRHLASHASARNASA